MAKKERIAGNRWLHSVAKSGNYSDLNDTPVLAWITKKTTALRDAIPLNERVLGMVCYISDEGKYYTLKNGIGNDFWEDFKIGGGNVMPTITADEEYPSGKKIYYSDGKLAIPVKWTSPNFGAGQIFTTVDGVTKANNKVSQGIVSWDITDYIIDGTHKYQCYITDAAGLSTDALSYTIVSGGLKLSSEFENYLNKTAITTDTDISLTLNVDCGDSDSTIELTYTLTEKTTVGSPITKTITVSNGVNLIKIGKAVAGSYKLTLDAVAGDLQSNTLSYTFDVLSKNEIRMLVTDVATTYDTSTRIIIPFRVTMYNQSKFYTEVQIDDGKVEQLSTNFGLNTWNIGKLPEGRHTLKLKSSTLDKIVYSNPVEITIDVNKAVYTRMEPYMDGLVAYYDADDMSNNLSTKTSWKNKVSGSNNNIELNELNYSSNGWIEEDLGGGYSQKNLKFTGESFGTLDIAPFKNFDSQAGNGLTIDIMFRTRNIGNLDARVVSCVNSNGTAGNGFWITPDTINLKPAGTTGLSVDFSEDTWTRATFLIDKAETSEGPARYAIYVNAVLCGVNLIAPDDSFDSLDTITFNAFKTLGTMGNFGQCEIRSFRIYNKALTSDQILQNHIADIKVDEEQEAKKILNYGESGKNTLPIIRLNSNIPTDSFEHLYAENNKKKKIQCTVSYQPVDGDVKIWNKAEVSFQGTSTLAYAIKNFRVYFKDDEGKDTKWAPPETNWKPESLVTLKCDYMESSHRNNTGLAKFIPTLYNEKVPPQIDDPTVRTTVDGHPVLLYQDDVLVGTYILNMDKKAFTNFGFDTKTEEGELKYPLCKSYEVVANSDTTSGAFQKYDLEDIAHDFDVRYAVNKKEQPIALQRLVQFVCDSTDDEFYKNLHEYMNVSYTINYYIAVITFGMVDNFGKNMMLNTWDDKIWYPSFYDMDTCFGLNNSGEEKFGPDIELTSDEEYSENLMENEQLPIRKKAYNTSGSKLWRKLRRCFDKEIKARYAELRKGPLLYDNIIKELVTDWTNLIGERYYNYNAKKKYLEHPSYIYMCHGNRTEKFKRWMKERLIFLDTLMNYTAENGQKIDIRVNKSGESQVVVRTYSPMYVNIEYMKNTFTGPQYCSPDATYKVMEDGKEVVKQGTVFTFNINAETDQEFYISCAKHILSVDGLYNLIPSKVDIQYAEKLTGLDIRGSSYITQLFLGNNKYLSSLNCSDCVNLGTVTSNLDISNCINMKTLNLTNTKLTSVSFPLGGALKTINLTNTPITAVSLESLEFLDTLILTGCDYISTFNIQDCSKITSIELRQSAVTSFKAVTCNAINYIDLSGNNSLVNYEITGCGNIRAMNLDGLNSTVISDLNLSTMYNLETLTAKNCAYLKNIIFPMYESEEEALKVAEAINSGKPYVGKRWNKLKSLDLYGSTIKTCRYGSPKASDPTPTYFDMEYLTNLETLRLAYCTQLTDIRNINYTSANLNELFRNCTKLNNIEGKITGTGSANSVFMMCNALSTISGLTLDFSRVTSINSICQDSGNNGPTLAFITQLLSSCGSRLTSINSAFLHAYNIRGTLPANLFNNCPNITNMGRAFLGCTNVTGIDVGITNYMTKVTDMNYMFRECTGLRTLNPQLLYPLVSLSNATGMFWQCTNITNFIDNTSFSKCTNLTTTHGMFFNCTNMVLNNITGMFNNCTRLNSTKGMFYNCQKLTLSSFPEGLLGKLTQLNNCEGMFALCTGLTCAAPVNLFIDSSSGSKCSSLTSAGGMFAKTRITGRVRSSFFNGAENLTSASDINIQTNLWDTNTYVYPGGMFSNTKISYYDADLFSKVPKIRNIKYFFSECTELKGCYLNDSLTTNCIAEDLFKENTSLSNVDYFFFNCTSLTGRIPANLFKYNKGLTTASYFLSGCKTFTGKDANTMEKIGIPSTLFANHTSLNNISYFFNDCLDLDAELPSGLLTGCSGLNSVAGLFRNCKLLYGLIPKAMFKDCRSLISVKEIFSGCELIESEIPEDLFNGCQTVKDMSYIFYNCKLLKGEIPENLFANCDSLENISYAFYYCKNLITKPEEVYAIPANLFINNPFLKHVTATFQECTGLKGTLPFRLFFKQEQLLNANNLFVNCSGITGEIDSEFMSSCSKLQNLEQAFYACSGLTGIGADFLSGCKQITNVHGTWRSCSKLKGMAPLYWKTHTKITSSNACFSGATGLTNHPSNSASSALSEEQRIPTAWATGY